MTTTDARKRNDERKKAAAAARRGTGYQTRSLKMPARDALTNLDIVTAKVGADFPALGTLLRTGWTEGA